MRQLGGLHRFMAWPRAILTDSGGFQVFSLNELRKVTEEGVTFRSHLDGSSHFFSPESAMEAQIGLGADIIMAFDECTEFPADRERARQSMELTLRWAARSKKYFEEHKKEVPWNAGFRFPVSQFPERQTSETRKPENPGNGRDRAYAVSGAFRDCAGRHGRRAAQGIGRTHHRDRFSRLRHRRLERGRAARSDPRDRRSYACRIFPRTSRATSWVWARRRRLSNTPMPGVDMMDCVLPTRAARHGLLFTSQGRISIKQARFAADQGPLDPNCGCRVCRRYSRAYLRHLYAANEVLAQVLNTVHNLSFYLDTMRSVRHSIALGNRAQLLSGEQSGVKP